MKEIKGTLQFEPNYVSVIFISLRINGAHENSRVRQFRKKHATLATRLITEQPMSLSVFGVTEHASLYR